MAKELVDHCSVDMNSFSFEYDDIVRLFLQQCVHLCSPEVSTSAFNGSSLIHTKIKWSTVE